MINTSKLHEEQTKKIKKTYSYKDIVSLSSANNLYGSMGKMILSNKKSNERATFGKAERNQSKKVLEPFRMAEIQNIGKESKGPAAYLPPRFVMENGEVVQTKNPDEKLKYNQAPSYKMSSSQRFPEKKQKYNYYNYKNDELDVNQADAGRRNTSPNILIGVSERFPKQRADKITPGPTYDPVLRPEAPSAPKYTLGSRRSLKGQDPLVPTTSTTNLVGPGTYFQKSKSQSTGSLSRVPFDSMKKNQPAISFTKGPKTLAQYKASVDQTYDLKTKTIMAHYDFEYDAGKGLHSGLAYMKKNIMDSSNRPLEKNKMKSYTMAKSSRQIQKKRGNFVSMMSNAPATVRIAVPKF